MGGGWRWVTQPVGVILSEEAIPTGGYIHIMGITLSDEPEMTDDLAKVDGLENIGDLEKIGG